MHTGLLWYDDDQGTDLAHKVARAAARYRQKYGLVPNTCFVHPSALGGNGKTLQVGPVRITSMPSVLRHHFWIGVQDGN